MSSKQILCVCVCVFPHPPVSARSWRQYQKLLRMIDSRYISLHLDDSKNVSKYWLKMTILFGTPIDLHM